MTVKPTFLRDNRLFIVLIVVTTGLFFLWRLYDIQIKDPLERILLDEPVSISAFSLQTGNKTAFTEQQLNNYWTFLFFGYTSCPDVCPTTLNEMAILKKRLAKTTQRNKIQVVFISVDPARDTPEHLKNFVAYFDNEFIGATGTIDQLNVLTEQVNVRHKRLTEQRTEQDDDYLVEHSADILLFSPKAKLIAKFPAPHYSEELVKHFNNIILQQTTIQQTL